MYNRKLHDQGAGRSDRFFGQRLFEEKALSGDLVRLNDVLAVAFKVCQVADMQNGL